MNNTVKNKEKLQNTKKIKDIVKRFNIYILSLVFLFSSFCFSFADSSQYGFSLPLYSSKPSSLTSSTITYTDSNYTYYVGSSNNAKDYFYFENNGSKVFIIVFDYSSNGNYAYYQAQGYSSVNQSSAYNSQFGYSYVKAINSSENIPYLGSFDTYESAAAYYSQNGVNYGEEPVNVPFTLYNGYLFVFDLGQSGSSFSFNLSSTSEEYSDIGSDPFPNTNQSYWFSNSKPVLDETQIPDNSQVRIIWSKGSNANIFGQTKNMISTISGTSSGRYLYLYNPPVHYNWTGNSNPTASETVNYPVVINGVSDNDTWYLYNSVAILSDFNQGGKVTGTTIEEIVGTVSDGAIELTTSEGSIYVQNSGGATDISGANGGSIAENINGLKKTLDDFVNQFIQLLSAPISHIQQLIQSSNQFFDVFSQLFEWLPSELSSVIVSGLIIMVVIGVIKMLL